MSEELEILHLAQRCHTSWCEAKREAGYTYGPVTDDSAKTNANLVPWSFLPEEIKESNINTARETYNLVSKSGFKFVHAASIIPAFKEYAAKMIAKELHLAWARDKIAAGWTYSPITDKAAKKHRDLCVIAGVCSYSGLGCSHAWFGSRLKVRYFWPFFFFQFTHNEYIIIMMHICNIKES